MYFCQSCKYISTVLKSKEVRESVICENTLVTTEALVLFYLSLSQNLVTSIIMPLPEAML